MKKHLLIYAFLALLGWCVCPQAWANGIEVNGIYYLFSGTTATVTYPGASAPTNAATNGYTGEITIPATVEYNGTTYNVTKIGDQAFRYSTVTKLTFSEGLQTLGSYSLNNMTEITEFIFPNSMTSCGGGDPLSGCSKLEKIVFGTSFTYHGQGTCYSGTTKLKDVYFLSPTPPTTRGAYFLNACRDLVTIHVLETAEAAYKTAYPTIGFTTVPKIVADIEAPMSWSDFQTALASYNAIDIYTGDDPGRFKAADAVAFLAAREAANLLTESSTGLKQAVLDMQSTYTALSPKTNPITAGYYYIVTAGKGPGYPFNGTVVRNTEYQSAIYNDGASGRVKWKAYDVNDYSLIYKLTENGSDWNVQSLVDGTYMGVTSGPGEYGNILVPVSAEPKAQHFDWIRSGKFGMKGAANYYYYGQNGDHNGSTDASGNLSIWGSLGDATSGGMNQWFLIPVAQSTILAYQETVVGDMVATANDYKTKVAAMKTGTAPGLYNATKAQEMIDAADKAIGLASSTDLDAKLAVVEEMKNAWLALLAAVNPLTEGYYVFINDNANIAANGKAEKAMFINTTTSEMNWGTYEENNLKYIFKVTASGDNWLIQNVENGLYTGGATAFLGVHPALSTPTCPMNITGYDGSGSFVIKETLTSVKWTYCASNNAAGTNDGPSTIFAYNGDGTAAGGAPYKEWTWNIRPVPESDLMNLLYLNPAKASLDAAITPANHHDNTGTRSFLLGNEKTSIDGISTSKEAVDALQEAYDALNAAAQEGKTVSECESLITALNNAKAVVDAKSNPLVDGYYYLIGEYGDDTNDTPGGFAIQYGAYASNAMSATKKPFDASETAQMFKVEYDKENGKVYLQNVASGYYLGALKSSRWEFVAEKTALNIVTGENYYWFHNATKAAAARSCSFVLTDTNATGISSTTATGSRLNPVYNVTTGSSAWTISWAFRPVAESLIPQVDVDVDAEDGIATITYAGALTEELYLAALEGIDKTKVRSVDLSTVNVNMVPTQVTNPFENTNTMFYMADDYAHPNEGINLVTQGKCPSLILVDKEDFVPAKAFEAKNATYLKAGSLDTEGWYSVVLPFDYVVDASLEVLNNAVVKDATIAFSAVEAGETIPAGTPFIYKSKVDGPFSILQVNVNCSVAANATPSASGALKGTYVKIPKGSATGKLILNAAGSAFATATANASIPAFRAYIDGAVGSGTFTITINDDLTGVVGADADLNAKVDVYSVDGKLVRQGVEAITALQGLESGIYVINGKTIKK